MAGRMSPGCCQGREKVGRSPTQGFSSRRSNSSSPSPTPPALGGALGCRPPGDQLPDGDQQESTLRAKTGPSSFLAPSASSQACAPPLAGEGINDALYCRLG